MNTNFLRFMYEDDVPYGWRSRIEGAKTDIEKGELLSEAYEHYNDVMDQEAELRDAREKAHMDMFYF